MVNTRGKLVTAMATKPMWCLCYVALAGLWLIPSLWLRASLQMKPTHTQDGKQILPEFAETVSRFTFVTCSSAAIGIGCAFLGDEHDTLCVKSLHLAVLI
jgi:hypothetical protein